ncbi:MAG: hypothetical protein AAGA63_10120 [Pseudomonadota bacterium]
MTSSVFYAWQSDRDRDSCKHFIRKCLDVAVKELKAEIGIEDADRPEIKVVQDTQGVAGSPDIANTTFSRIEGCAAFVDLPP